jgi:hypothetical protein
MPAFDRLLLDPTPEALMAALGEAARTANARCRSGLVERPTPAAATAVLAGQPEGVVRWSHNDDPGQRSTVVGLAWWSDRLGHKHVRVVGRRREPGNQLWDNVFDPLDDPRPGAWLVHPDRLYLRTLPDQQREVIAVCDDCGASGPPERLGWRGDCCGPCYDRRQEGAAPAPPAVLRGHDAAVRAVGFADGAGRLVSLAGYYPVGPTPLGPQWTEVPFLAWDLADGTAHPLRLPRRNWQDANLALAVHPDGQTATVGSLGTVSLWDAHSLKKRVQWSVGSRIVRLAFAPNSQTLAVLSVSRLMLWTLGPLAHGGRPLNADGSGVLTWARPARELCLAFAPNGRWLALGGAGQLVRQDVAPVPLEEVPLLHAPSVNDVAFSPDGRTLALAVHDGSGIVNRPGEVRTWDVAQRRPGALHGAHPRRVEAVAFTPDGRFVVAAGLDGAIRFWDVSAGELALTLEWHLGAVLCLAFSIDGQTLATGSADGTVKLWPWRALLPG